MTHTPAQPASTHPPEHPPYLAHHFDSPEQQEASGKIGMWVFLATEVLMFGGLFCAYAVYRANHPEVFAVGHRFLDTNLGAINTVVLLLSSFTMAWAVRAAQLGRQRRLIILLLCTIVGGFGFMGIKYVEYKAKFVHHLGPGHWYNPAAYEDPVKSHAAAGGIASQADTPTAESSPTPEVEGEERSHLHAAATAPEGLAQDVIAAMPPVDAAAPGSQAADAHGEAGHGDGEHGESHYQASQKQFDIAFTFFSIYYLMTGLHGIHVLIGIGLIGWLVIRAILGHFSAEYFAPVDLVGLYWHLVDLIWIFLFPLLYLIH